MVGHFQIFWAPWKTSFFVFKLAFKLKNQQQKKKKKKGVEKYRGLSLFFVSHLSPKASAKKKQKAMVKRGNQIKGLKGEISKSKFGLKTAQTKAIQCIYLYICGTLTMDLILQFQQGKFFNWAFIFSIQHSHV